MMPMPFGDGQISALISLSCQVWWPWPSVGPLSSTTWTQASKLSRHQIQPLNEARRKRVAMSSLAGLRQPAACEAKMPSWSMAVPADSIEMTDRSSGLYSSPVSGFVASSTWAYSL